MSLHLQYRPSTFDEVIGNRTLVTSLSGMLKDKESCPHSFLLHGPTGCGKTSIARIIAKELGCHENNLNEIDSAQFRGIDTIRDLRINCQLAPLGGGVKVYVIDECHALTGIASDAFLKTLEDTPRHVYFILCTTDPQKLSPTIKGRCSQFQTSSLTENEMESLLRKIVLAENETLDQEVIDQIINDSQGLPRNALQILEQVLSVPERRRLKLAKQVAAEQSESIALCRALINGDNWNKISVILKGLKGQDPEGVRRVVLGYATSVLLNKENDIAGTVLECFEEPLYNVGFPGLVLACYRVVKGE